MLIDDIKSIGKELKSNLFVLVLMVVILSVCAVAWVNSGYYKESQKAKEFYRIQRETAIDGTSLYVPFYQYSINEFELNITWRSISEILVPFWHTTLSLYRFPILLLTSSFMLDIALFIPIETYLIKEIRQIRMEFRREENS